MKLCLFHSKFFQAAILCLTLTIMQNSGYAEEKKFPPGCREVNFHFDSNLLILDYNHNPKVETQDQTIYLVHNTSYNEIKLEIAQAQKYLPTYTKIIPGGSWAAIAKDQSPLQLACYNHSQYSSDLTEDCSQLLELCNYNNAKFPPQNIGTYWLDRTGDLTFIKHYAIRKGILLRW